MNAMAGRMCTRKVGYSETAAWRNVHKMRKRGDTVHAYHCFICGHWHIGNERRESARLR